MRPPLLQELSNWLAERDFYLWDVGGEYREPHHDTLMTLDCFFLSARSELSRLNKVPLKRHRDGLGEPLGSPSRRSWKERIRALLQWSR